MRWLWMLLLFGIAACAVMYSDALFTAKQVLLEAGTPSMALWLFGVIAVCAAAGLLLGARRFGLLALAAGLGAIILLPTQSSFSHIAAPWLAAYGLHVAGLVPTALQAVVPTMPATVNWLLPLTLCAFAVASMLLKGTKVE